MFRTSCTICNYHDYGVGEHDVSQNIEGLIEPPNLMLNVAAIIFHVSVTYLSVEVWSIGTSNGQTKGWRA